MKEIVKLGLILFIISTIAAVALAGTNSITAPIIELQREAKSELARKEVLPTADSFEQVNANDYDSTVITEGDVDVPVIEVYRGVSAGQTVGYVVKTAPGGYGGAVEVVTGIAEGVVTGVRVGKHQETPGLGAKSTLPEFYSQYDGKMAATVSVNKTQSSDSEVQAISGATITSKAVTAGVNASAGIAKSQE
ncbi:MAG: electron transporter [Clostridiales bacterium]|nr:MAG: electron transporter [Clostridiales bacterium]